MKCLNRNKAQFYFALYMGKEPITDDYSNMTGEYTVLHKNPLEGRCNVSAAKGETQIRQFGEDETYDKVIVIDEELLIDEYTWLWVDTMPLLDENGALKVNEDNEIVTPHDYIVKKVAKSLNCFSYAISKVKVNGN